MLIGVIVGKKINILFKFSNVNKLVVNSFGLWTVGRAADSAQPLRPRAWRSRATDFHIFQSTAQTKPEMECAVW